MREIDRENLVKHCNRVYITVYILLVYRQQLIQIASTGLAQHVLEWGGGGGKGWFLCVSAKKQALAVSYL